MTQPFKENVQRKIQSTQSCLTQIRNVLIVLECANYDTLLLREACVRIARWLEANASKT